MDNTIADVQQDSSPAAASVTAPLTADPVVSAGDKTPSENLLAALHEEREYNKTLREEINNLRATTNPAPDTYQDEPDVYKELTSLKEKIISLEESKELDALYAKHPALKETTAEFNEFRKEFPRHKLENVAKLFLVEKGLIGTDEPRKGLEQPTGGAKTAPTVGMTAEDVSNLRKNDYKKYTELLRAGKLRDIK